jgi:hypothetical protein
MAVDGFGCGRPLEGLENILIVSSAMFHQIFSLQDGI